MSFTPAETAPVAIIIPARDEAACIAAVLDELLLQLDVATHVVAVGVNDSTDATAEIARNYPVVVAETPARGYGHGCQAAIDAVTAAHPNVSAYVFFAGDGASNPSDVARLTLAFQKGSTMVLGARPCRRGNWRVMTLPHVLANFSLGLWCGVLTGRWFTDLAPLRLIERRLFETLALQEMKFGWTIEAQVGAAILGAAIAEVPAEERGRIGGEQKVSGVNWRRTFVIGCRILAAGWRAQRRYLRTVGRDRKCVAHALVPQPQPNPQYQ